MQSTRAASGNSSLLILPADILLAIIDYLGLEDIFFLLRSGANVADILTKRHLSYKNDYGETLLHLVCRVPTEIWTGSIISRSPDISCTTNMGKTPIDNAVIFNFEMTVRLLINAGAKISVRDSRGGTPLLYAAEGGNIKIIQLLLEAGAYPSGDGFGPRPIHWAAVQGDANVIQLLLDHGADISSRTPVGGAALQLAALHGHCDVVELLLKNGADSLLRSSTDEIPLACAVAKGHVPVIKLLLTAGKPEQVRTIAYAGASLLHLAAGGGYYGYYGVQILCNVIRQQERSTEGLDLLERLFRGGAADYACEEIIEILLHAGVEVSPQMMEGITPLHFAAVLGRKRPVQLLLEAGADPAAETAEGFTAGMLARLSGHEDVCEVLGDPMSLCDQL